jgi:NDP-sugar pyrophosphorylase family protein
MKAMILAAGLGTRLRPLTNDRPKALVTVAGRTLLEIVLSRLRTFGVSEAIVNTHHCAEMISDYLQTKDNFGMRIEVSREDHLLDTGGGLKRVAPFFHDSSRGLQEPFILHNVDVISSIDLGRMVRFHMKEGALATLAVQERETSRYLLFDKSGRLCGRRLGRTTKERSRHTEDGRDELVRPVQQTRAIAFSGIHVLSPRIFEKMDEEGAFSIIDAYLHLAAQGEKIMAFSADGCYWRDLGRPEDLAEAARDLADGKYSVT